MASDAQFHLFPPPPPRINTIVESNPFRRPHSKLARNAASFPLETLASSPGAEAVVIHVAGGSSKIQSLPQAHLSSPKGAKSGLISGDKGLDEDKSASHQDAQFSSASSSFRFPSQATAPLAASSAPPSYPVQSNVPLSPAPNSPIQPIRSMFPVFNPNLPLSQQDYYPQRETVFQGQATSRKEYSPEFRSPSLLDQALGGVKTAPSSVLEFPTDDDAAVPRPRMSSPQELESLWEVANGEPAVFSRSLPLNRSRAEAAIFTFGSSPSLPFYSLQTYDTDELAIHRTHPRKPAVKVPVLLLSLEPEARRKPPHDGLVSYVFPKLASMLAVDQSNELAAQHGLAPAHRDQMQAEAVARAAAQESSQLFWNESGRRYELAHPAIGRDQNHPPQFVQSPTWPRPSQLPVLHITVSSHALSSPSGFNTAPPVIMVTNPDRCSMALSTPSHPRASTIPVHESSEPLASLDFSTMTLHLSTPSILQLMPSLYAIDVLVSAVLAVAVADSVTNPLMAEMDISSPRTASTATGRSYTGSTLHATLAERDVAEEEAKLMKQLREQYTTGKANKVKRPPNDENDKNWRPFATFWKGKCGKPGTKKQSSKPKSKSKRQPKKIMVTEFDLEKLCHYQSGNRQGQKLPAITRSALEAMVVGLQLVVWILTTLVRVLAWILVRVTRAVTSEKF